MDLAANLPCKKGMSAKLLLQIRYDLRRKFEPHKIAEVLYHLTSFVESKVQNKPLLSIQIDWVGYVINLRYL